MSGLADHAEMAYQNLYNLFSGKVKSCTPETLKKLSATADHFELLPDPVGPTADRVRTIAKKNGWN